LASQPSFSKGPPEAMEADKARQAIDVKRRKAFMG
jgi:hypothetical protein